MASEKDGDVLRLFLKAPAKINLALDVLGRRADGYHRVRMVMTTIDLADRLEIEPRSQGIQVHTTSGLLPEDSRNLAYQAAALVKERFAIEQGVAISIRKHIPVAAGLAGGSSDAAAVLRGLNRLWRLGLKVPELAQLGAEIGSDVVFCVYGGTALTRGRGEVVQPIASPPPCWVVLAKPEAGLSTKAMYQLLDAAELVHPNIDAVANSMTGRDFDALCRHLGNVFEDVVLPSMPQVALIKEKMELLGADGVLMSGSGPTVFGLTRLESRMRRIVNGLRGFCPYVYGVRMGGAVPVADHGFGEVGDV